MMVTKRELIEFWEDIPDDASINLSTFILMTEDEGAWEVILDQPIHGIAYNEDTKEIRLAVHGKNRDEAYQLAAFGIKAVKKFE